MEEGKSGGRENKKLWFGADGFTGVRDWYIFNFSFWENGKLGFGVDDFYWVSEFFFSSGN